MAKNLISNLGSNFEPQSTALPRGNQNPNRIEMNGGLGAPQLGMPLAPVGNATTYQPVGKKVTNGFLTNGKTIALKRVHNFNPSQS